MLFAEAVQIDPGVVILILVVFALSVALVIAVAAGTPVAGFRYGVDPGRKRARLIWIVGLCLEGGAFVLTVAAGEPWPILAIAALVAISIGAWRLGLHRSTLREPPTP